MCSTFDPPLANGLKKLQQFRSSSFLTDITLSFEDQHFVAHKFVISSFTNLLDSTTISNETLTLDFHDFPPDPDVLSLVLSSLYNLPFTVDLTNFVDVYNIARKLRFTSLISFCNKLKKEGFQSNSEFIIDLNEYFSTLVSNSNHDVELLYCNNSIKTNRVVLSLFSSYFEKKFSSDWKELKLIDLGKNLDVDSSIFSLFIKSFMGKSIEINVENLYEIRYLAHNFDFSELLSFCDEFINSNTLNVSILHHADKFNDQLFIEKFLNNPDIEFGELVAITPNCFKLLTSCPSVDVDWLAKSLVFSWKKMSCSWTVENFTKILNSFTINSDNIVSFQSIISDLLTVPELETVINRFILKNIPNLINSQTSNEQVELLKAELKEERSKREQLEETLTTLQETNTSFEERLAVLEAVVSDLKSSPPKSTFHSFKFTNAGATGRFGPSLNDCIRSYSTDWVRDSSSFSVNEGIQNWTVPFTGTFRIECAGASGGWGRENPSTKPGRGVVIGGEFDLFDGQVLQILVGQMGCDAQNGGNRAGGGGGGSFVVHNGTPLIVAGGGSGQNWGDWTTDGTDARVDNNGTGGGSGERGGGGGGFSSDGQNATSGNSTGGKSFINGGIGGTSDTISASFTAHGGFGGGGGTRYEGGGGGGYTGGRVVPQNQYNNTFPEYGAGSFNSGRNQVNKGTNEGHGYVTISCV
ncbi:hypothetical protein P9112_008261 [Eukaryota sp. TZLM1-RC]